MYCEAGGQNNTREAPVFILNLLFLSQHTWPAKHSVELSGTLQGRLARGMASAWRAWYSHSDLPSITSKHGHSTMFTPGLSGQASNALLPALQNTSTHFRQLRFTSLFPTRNTSSRSFHFSSSSLFTPTPAYPQNDLWL